MARSILMWIELSIDTISTSETAEMERTYAVTPMTTGSPASASVSLRAWQVSQVYLMADSAKMGAKLQSGDCLVCLATRNNIRLGSQESRPVPVVVGANQINEWWLSN